MIDFLLALPLAILSFSKNWDFDDLDDKIVSSSSALEIARDSTFSNKTNEFSAGQTVYVRVTSEVSGSTKRELNLRDNSYNLITAYGLSSAGGNQYTASFAAPNTAGIYSLEARLESDGSVVNLVQTIEVGGNGNSNSTVSVNINNEVNTGGEVKSSKSGISPSPEATPSSNPEDKESFWGSIWNKIWAFFDGIF
ncbi:hypothetical protein HYZ70_01035 [Candidatus Curtissbacteria bacterium]|nr:hypothetical protein [Candidatus Curtissbacteria bacterium]